jgi:hypothetical protein
MSNISDEDFVVLNLPAAMYGVKRSMLSGKGKKWEAETAILRLAGQKAKTDKKIANRIRLTTPLSNVIHSRTFFQIRVHIPQSAIGK